MLLCVLWTWQLTDREVVVRLLWGSNWATVPTPHSPLSDWLYWQTFKPYGLIGLIFGGLALLAAPSEEKSRFTLRTLLIVTTLVAVVLGVIVWVL